MYIGAEQQMILQDCCTTAQSPSVVLIARRLVVSKRLYGVQSGSFLTPASTPGSVIELPYLDEANDACPASILDTDLANGGMTHTSLPVRRVWTASILLTSSYAVSEP